jgi:hypothetical protein
MKDIRRCPNCKKWFEVEVKGQWCCLKCYGFCEPEPNLNHDELVSEVYDLKSKIKELELKYGKLKCQKTTN